MRTNPYGWHEASLWIKGEEPGENPVEQIMARSKGRMTELPMKDFPDFGQVISPQGFDFSPEGLADHCIEKL